MIGSFQPIKMGSNLQMGVFDQPLLALLRDSAKFSSEVPVLVLRNDSTTMFSNAFPLISNTQNRSGCRG